MSEIKLEVGQVWRHHSGYKWEVIGVYENNGVIIEMAMKSLESGKLSMHDTVNWTKFYTLITNADGTPYIKPNDYRAGDVWAYFGGNKTPETAYLIKGGDDEQLRVLSRYTDANIVDCPAFFGPEQHHYKLVYRHGKGVIS